MTVNIQIPERSYQLLQKEQAVFNAMITAMRATLDVPDGWQLTSDGRSFMPPVIASVDRGNNSVAGENE